MLWVTRSKLYNNYYSIVGSFLDAYYLIKFFPNKSIFHEILRKGSSKSLLLELFANIIALLAKRIVLSDNISSSWGNWGTIKSSYSIGDNKENMVKKDNDMVEGREKDLENIDN